MIPSRHERQRFWCPREGAFGLDDRGYFVDATETLARAYNLQVEYKRPLGSQCGACRLPVVVVLRSYGREDQFVKNLTGGISAVAKWMAVAISYLLFHEARERRRRDAVEGSGRSS